MTSLTFHVFCVSLPIIQRGTTNRLFSSVTCSFVSEPYMTHVASLGAWLMLHCLNIPNKTVKCNPH